MYPIRRLLLQPNDMQPDSQTNLPLVICAYSINREKTPFLQYLLTSGYIGDLSLPVLNYNSPIKLNDAIDQSSKYITQLITPPNHTASTTNMVEFVGFYEFEEKLYLFFDLSQLQVNETNKIKMALMTEIVNHYHVSNQSIHPKTITFFLVNDSLVHLYDQNNELIEIPEVAYCSGTNDSQLKFKLMFGESPRDKTAQFGNFYYFSPMVQSCSTGSVRFAVFLGKTKYLEQDSDLTDHDGNWALTEGYDSLYLPRSNDASIKDRPSVGPSVIVLKTYDQQIPLSLKK